MNKISIQMNFYINICDNKVQKIEIHKNQLNNVIHVTII